MASSNLGNLNHCTWPLETRWPHTDWMVKTIRQLGKTSAMLKHAPLRDCHFLTQWGCWGRWGCMEYDLHGFVEQLWLRILRIWKAPGGRSDPRQGSLSLHFRWSHNWKLSTRWVPILVQFGSNDQMTASAGLIYSEPPTYKKRSICRPGENCWHGASARYLCTYKTRCTNPSCRSSCTEISRKLKVDVRCGLKIKSNLQWEFYDSTSHDAFY